MSEAIIERLRRSVGELPRAERLVARALMADYPSAGLETVAKLAARAGVSGPTVLRLVERVGFAGYADFQAALRDELSLRGRGPLAQFADVEVADPFERARLTFARTVSRTFELVEPREFDAAVALLASARGRVLITGGRFSGLVARSLAQHLEILRPGVVHLAPDDRPGALLDAGPRDVAVVFDLRRYQRSSFEFAEAAAGRRTPVVLVTDEWRSPALRIAQIVLPVALDAPSPFDSLIGAETLAEALVAGVVDALGPATRARLEAFDAHWTSSDFPDAGALDADTARPPEEETA